MKWDEGYIDGVHDEKSIKGFNEEYRWLSNYFPCTVMWKGLIFKSSEAAYQAAKSLDPKEWVRFSNMGAGTSKKEGKKIQIRDDWEDVKIKIMGDIVMDKFLRNLDLREKLLATGDKFLEETNWWGDTFWGVCKGKGQNHLGKVLMAVRELFKVNPEIYAN